MTDRRRIDPTTVALTLAALVAFASNSLLTRLALGSRQIDAATFTSIRLVSGAAVLAVLARVRSGSWDPLRGSRATAIVLGLVAPLTMVPSIRGVILAIVSGAVASGLGYAVWYRALPRLSLTQAAVAQLSVPVIAAMGAMALLREPLTARLVIAGTAVLSGVALVLAARTRVKATRTK